MTTAIYKRISDDKMGREYGIARQEKECRALAKSRGWDDVVIYSDNDISALKGAPRRGYRDLMRAVEAGNVHRIVVFHLSRLWRSRAERAAAIEVLRKHRVTIAAARGAELDMSTAMGRSMAAFLGEIDTLESENKSERLEAWAAQRAELGQHHGGPAPYGYRHVTTDVKGADGKYRLALEVEPDEAAKVKQWYADLLAGRSLTSIARTAKVGRRQLSRRLTNACYAGLRIHNGQEYPAAFEAIVDADTWRAAQAILSAPERFEGDKSPARRHLGSGLYVCERCGRTVYADYSARTNRGTDRGYLVYRCVPGRGGCGRRWRAEWCDAFVEGVTRARLGKGDLANLLPKTSPDLRKLADEAAGIRARLKTLASEFVLLGLDEDSVKATAERARKRLGEIERELGAGDVDGLGAELAGADDPVAVYDRAALTRKQAIIARLMTVTLTAPPRGLPPRAYDLEQQKAWYVQRCVTIDPKRRG